MMFCSRRHFVCRFISIFCVNKYGVIFFFSSIMIVALEHSLFLVAFVQRETKARNPSLFAPQALLRKICVIRTLLICDWSIQQNANKPQKQKEKNVVRLWVAVSLLEVLRDIPKTAAKETSWKGANAFNIPIQQNRKDIEAVCLGLFNAKCV